MEFCKFCMQTLQSAQARFCPHCGKEQSAPVPEHHLAPGTVVGGRFVLGAALGEGGFGITYIGMDTKLRLRVAVKEFYPYGFVTRAAASPTVSCSANEQKKAFFEKGRARFLQEAQTLARFSGEPGIVDVRDFFEENNTAYIVMEYLEGETLKTRLQKHGPLSPDEALRLLSPVMRSLSRLHKENLIHRDVSPDNIMLTETGVKLLDFGAARFFDGGDKSLSVMLKPGYAPIEQYQSRGKQGPWTDVYALSATIYRCVTGARVPEATERLMEDTLQAPSALGVEMGPALEKALLQGLAVRPDDRLQSVDVFIDTIDNNNPSQQTIPIHPFHNLDITQAVSSSTYNNSAKSTKAKKRTLLISAITFLIVALILFFPIRACILGCINDITANNRDSTKIKITIGENMNTYQVIELLKEYDLIYSAGFCKFYYCSLNGHDKEEIYPSGIYALSPDMGINGMLKTIRTEQASSNESSSNKNEQELSQDNNQVRDDTVGLNDTSVTFSINGLSLDSGYQYIIKAKNQSNYSIIGFTIITDFFDEDGNLVDENKTALDDIFYAGSEKEISFISNESANNYKINWTYSNFTSVD